MNKTFWITEKTISKLERHAKLSNIKKSKIVDLAIDVYCESPILSKEEALEEIMRLEEVILRLTARLEKLEKVI